MNLCNKKVCFEEINYIYEGARFLIQIPSLKIDRNTF